MFLIIFEKKKRFLIYACLLWLSSMPKFYVFAQIILSHDTQILWLFL